MRAGARWAGGVLPLAGVAALLVGGLLLLVAGPLSGPPRSAVIEVDDQQVPHGLLAVGPAAEPTPEASRPGTDGPHLYLVDGDDELVSVPFDVASDGVDEQVVEVLRALGAGPTEEQRAAGLSSTVESGLSVRLEQVREGVAVVDVGTGVREPAADRLPLAVGQLVLSVTSVPGVDAVELVRAGQPVEAPLPGGARTTAPVGPLDYSGLLDPGEGIPAGIARANG